MKFVFKYNIFILLKNGIYVIKELFTNIYTKFETKSLKITMQIGQKLCRQTWDQISKIFFEVRNQIVRCVLMRGTRWDQNYLCSFIRWKFIGKKLFSSPKWLAWIRLCPTLQNHHISYISSLLNVILIKAWEKTKITC